MTNLKGNIITYFMELLELQGAQCGNHTVEQYNFESIPETLCFFLPGL